LELELFIVKLLAIIQRNYAKYSITKHIHNIQTHLHKLIDKSKILTTLEPDEVHP